MGDDLAGEDRLDADVVGDRGEDRRVLGEVERGRAASRWPGGGQEVGDDVHRVGGRAAVAERQQPPAGVEAVAQRRGGRGRAPRAFSASVCARSAPISADFISTERRTSASTASRSASRSAEERVQEARRAGVVDAALGAALQQAAVLEEHVHELPEHVVERLDQLLGDERVVAAGGSNSHSAPTRREGDRQAAALAGQRERRRGLAPSPSARRTPSRCRRARPAAPAPLERRAARRSGRARAAPACRRSPGGRTRPRRGGRPSAPRAQRRPRSGARRGRSARPSRGRAGPAARPRRSKNARRPRCARQQRVQRARRGVSAPRHAAPGPARRPRVSQSRHCVDALAGRGADAASAARPGGPASML